MLLCSEPQELCSGCLCLHREGPVGTQCARQDTFRPYIGEPAQFQQCQSIPSLQRQSQQPNVSSEDLTALQRGKLIPPAPL